MEVLYISTALSSKMSKIISEEQINSCVKGGLQESGNKFHGLIIKGLAKNGCNVTALSGRNISTKNYKKRIIKKYNDCIAQNIMYVYPKVLNFPILKQVYNSLDMYIYMLKWLFQNKNKEKCILIDAAYVTVLPSLVLATLWTKCSKIAIVADIYPYMAKIDKTKGIRNNVFRTISQFNYGKIDGFVFLTKYMNNVINKKNKPFIVMEGLVDNDFIIDNKIKNNKKKVIMYAGAIRKIFGLEELVNDFLSYKDSNTELWIFGDGDYSSEMKKVILSDKRIKYFGIQSNEKIMEFEKKATLLINPRNSKHDFTKYSFPSKNLEYMSSGTPMLGYKLKGIPDEYDKYIFYIDEKKGILNAINQLFNTEQKCLIAKGKAAQEYVLKSKNNIVQTNRIISLVKKVGKNNEKD